MLRPQALLDCFEDVGVGFVYILGVSEFLTSANSSTIEALQLLNRLWTRLDKITARLGVWKVEHVLSEYMVAGGLPQYAPYHHLKLADALLTIAEVLAQTRFEMSASATSATERQWGMGRKRPSAKEEIHGRDPVWKLREEIPGSTQRGAPHIYMSHT